MLIQACPINKPPVTPYTKWFFVVVAAALGHILVLVLAFAVTAMHRRVLQVLTA